MDNFIVDLKNVGCIDEGKINIVSKKVNIKFGPNGTGKSTIIKALRYKINDEKDFKKIITPFNSDLEPLCDISGNIKSLVVYDKAYFDKLFVKREDLLNNTYEFAIKDSNYDNDVKEINESLKDICEIANRKEFDDLISLYNELSGKKYVEYKKNGDGVNSRNSLFYSFATKGIALESLDSSSPIFEFSKYMSSQYRAEWLKRLESYKYEWTIDNICPFCGQKFLKSNFTLQKNIEMIKKYASSKEVNEHNKEQKFITNAASYCSDTNNGLSILNINSLTGKADVNTFKPLEDFINKLGPEIDKISKIRVQDAITLFNSFKDSKRKFSVLIDKIKDSRINENVLCVKSVLDDTGCDLVKEINLKINLLIEKANNIKMKLCNLTKNLTKKIKNNEKVINDFLKISGLPYEVYIEGESVENFKTLFKYKDDHNIIEDRLNYLSFGEANALALIIFAIENKDSDSLIVLDDPVSSFDTNKRYAIFNYLFNKKYNLFSNKTILIMTHDFQTVVSFAKSNILKECKKTFAYLLSANKKLIEKQFTEQDIYSSLLWYKEYSKNNNNDIYSRIVAARRVAEISEGIDDNIYNYLSGLVHCNEKPTISKNGQEFDETKIKELDEKVSKLLNISLTYDSLISKISNVGNLIRWYEDKSATRFAKTCITRLLVQQFQKKNGSIKSDVKFDVAWDFMCNSFHVETQYIYSIKNLFDSEIPNYIISLCDEIIVKIKSLIEKESK